MTTTRRTGSRAPIGGSAIDGMGTGPASSHGPVPSLVTAPRAVGASLGASPASRPAAACPQTDAHRRQCLQAARTPSSRHRPHAPMPAVGCHRACARRHRACPRRLAAARPRCLFVAFPCRRAIPSRSSLPPRSRRRAAACRERSAPRCRTPHLSRRLCPRRSGRPRRTPGTRGRRL